MPGGVQRYVLVVEGREIELSDGEVSLGRSRSCTIRVDHESVSRSHALVTLANGTALLRDLNSSNGTFVAGRRILSETILRSGDRLQLGAAVVEYRLLEPSGPVETTALFDAAEAEMLPRPPGATVPAPAAAPPAGSGSPSPLEISAADLFRRIDEEAMAPKAPVVAAAALEAVRSSGAMARPALGDVSLGAPAADREPSSSPGPPPRRLHEATLSQFPIRADGKSAPAERGAPTPRARKARPSAAWETRGIEGAGLFPRLLATMVDGVILLALNLLLTSPVFLVLLFREAFQSADLLRDWAFLGILVGCGVMICGANLWYVVGGWARTGRTPGKALLRLAVVPVGEAGATGVGLKAAFVRFLAWNLSGLLLGIGFLVVLFRKDRRALHDLLAGTRVIRTP